MRVGGMGNGVRIREVDGDLLGDALRGIGTASAGIADAGGIAADTGIGGKGVRTRGGGALRGGSTGDRDRMGVGEGVWMGSGTRSACGR